MDSLLNHLSLLYEAQLSALEVHFDTTRETDVKRSKQTLLDFFFDVQVNTIRPDIFFEVGAFSATTSIAIKEKLPKAQCFAFEANIHNYNLFRQEHDYEKAGVNYINAAVSEKAGRETLYVQTSVGGQPVRKVRSNNSLLMRQQAGVEYEELEVSAHSIDSFIQSEGISTDDKSISLWIDVEGVAFSVLQGMKDTLKNVQSIFIELEEKRYWEKQVLARRVFTYLIREGFVPIARDFEAPFQYNVIFVRSPITYRPSYKICRSAYFRSIGVHAEPQTEEPQPA